MFLVGRCVVTLTLLVAVCGGVHVKPTVYLIHEETDGMELPTDSAIKLAVRDVALNESTDLKWLPVPKCNGRTNYMAMFNTLVNAMAPGPVIILEGMCLEDSNLIAEASRQFNFILISYSSACLVEPVTYSPNQFCVVPTNVSFYYGIAGVFTKFGWTRAQIITEADYSLAYDTKMLMTVLNSSITSIPIREDCIACEQEVENLIVPNYHIIILNTSPEQARDIICEAEEGYPNYLWVVPDWYPHEWWTECGAMSKCTQEELKTFLNRSLIISYQPEELNDGTTTVSRRSPDEFRNQSFFAPYAYDSVWAIHLGLNESAQMLESCANFPENFTNCFTENLEKLNFPGVSGPVSFDDGIRTLDQVAITVLQFRRGSDAYGILNQERIGWVTNESVPQFGYKDNENNATVWPNGFPPDGTTIFIQKFIHNSTIVVFFLFAAAGIVFAIVCFTFTCAFRKRKLIRITSPGLTYMIIIGTILLYLSVIPTAHPRGLYEATEEVFCPLSTYVLLLGYNMALVTIDVRMWRVFYTYIKPYSKACKDWHLMIIIAILIVVDIITLTVTNAVPLERYFAPMFPDPEHPSTFDERGVPILFLVIQCVPRADNYWLIVIYAYKGLFQIVGVVLALLTIKMKVKFYNEATEVRRILYTTTVFLLLLLVELYFWLGYINVHAAVTSFGLCVISTLILGIIFIPKMAALYRDPKGEQITEAPSPSATVTVTPAKETNDSLVATNVLALKEEEIELEAVVN